MCLGDSVPAVAYYNTEDGRIVLLHTKVPPEPNGPGHATRLGHGVSKRLRAPNTACSSMAD